MPYKHWFVSRQKRQLTTILPALIAFSDICVGQKWAGNSEIQLKYEDELQNRGITVHGKLRARKEGTGGGGTRTLFKQMKDLGLVFTEDDNGICRLTLIAESLIKGEVTFVDAMRLQLQKYQYPSATSWSGSGAVDHEFKVHPFQFILRLLRDKELQNYLDVDEIAHIVMHEANSDSKACFNTVKSHVLKFRENGVASAKISEAIVISDDMDDQEIKSVKNKKMAYYNIANTLCNYLSLTQYIDRGLKTISIRQGKESDVDKFIQESPKYFSHPELSENYIRAFGRGYAAKDLRDFDHQDAKSTKEINEARIRKEYVLLALKTPITGITSDVIESISKTTGIDENQVERFLIKNYPHGNIDDFFASYKELAHMGTEGAREFEVATCEMFRKIFCMRAEHVGPIGNTPDVFIESEEGCYCAIIDNKAYKNGYSISGDHKRVMEDEYIKNVKGYGKSKYPLAFFTYIAGSFGKNINHQIQNIYRDTGVHGSAMPVDIFINMAQDYVVKGYDHNYLRRVFSVNREVKLLDLEAQKNDINLYPTSNNRELSYVAESTVGYGKPNRG